MADKVPYTITPRGISIVIGSRPKLVDATNINYAQLAIELRKPVHDVELIKELSDMSSFISRATFGAVQISEGQVRWKGKPIHGVIADRLMEMCKLGYDLEPLSRFLGNLMLNPLESTRDELYQWLEAGSAPITSDGHFLAYKAVRSNFRDKHTGTICNAPGVTVEMPRETVDANRNNHCSRGLHFCQYGYLSQFAHGDDKVVIVEIDPADVVSIPTDYKYQKGRTWRYKVVGVVGGADIADIFVGRPVNDDYAPVNHNNIDDEGEDLTSGLDNIQTGSDALNTAIDAPVYKDRTSRFDKPVIVSFDTPRALDAEEALLKLRNSAEKAPKVAPTAPPSGPLMFKNANGIEFYASTITQMVSEKGQRWTAKYISVGRSTLQGWLKKINNG